jgi:fructose-1,6-bisphosphatase/sedoheptulose 1,7-bisphosphatase-like protein
MKPTLYALDILLAAITDAKQTMATCNLTKDGDLAICIATALKEHGVKLVRIPTRTTKKGA